MGVLKGQPIFPHGGRQRHLNKYKSFHFINGNPRVASNFGPMDYVRAGLASIPGFGSESLEMDDFFEPQSTKVEDVTDEDVSMATDIIGAGFFEQGALLRRDSAGNQLSASQVGIVSPENVPIIKCSANVTRWIRAKLKTRPRSELPLSPEEKKMVRDISLSICTAYKTKQKLEDARLRPSELEEDLMYKNAIETIAVGKKNLSDIVDSHLSGVYEFQAPPASLSSRSGYYDHTRMSTSGDFLFDSENPTAAITGLVAAVTFVPLVVASAIGAFGSFFDNTSRELPVSRQQASRSSRLSDVRDPYHRYSDSESDSVVDQRTREAQRRQGLERIRAAFESDTDSDSEAAISQRTRGAQRRQGLERIRAAFESDTDSDSDSEAAVAAPQNARKPRA